MTKISFTVPGDPVGALRLTQGQLRLMRIPDARTRPDGMKIKNRIRAYLAYKDAVYKASMLKGINRAPKSKVILNVKAYFRNGKHPDPENVRKACQDAIFKQDKLVAGNVDFDYDAENPRVEIEIRSNAKGEGNENFGNIS